ncbi:hypothetical protein [Gloeobacter violaceus]|uniref:Glr0230 protein n=1 Tax=Gloeobacter violaceus (strain ATCC 29082 / PCC 7421) TaxID=251221 RepID=Q7NP28_GLOVI|nr:hypothetical protein [Gloeobacter violaceus]BAC88171.1 glr0230 [Gloeobacter violaceus PCC 7421]
MPDTEPSSQESPPPLAYQQEASGWDPLAFWDTPAAAVGEPDWEADIWDEEAFESPGEPEQSALAEDTEPDPAEPDAPELTDSDALPDAEQELEAAEQTLEDDLPLQEDALEPVAGFALHLELTPPPPPAATDPPDPQSPLTEAPAEDDTEALQAQQLAQLEALLAQLLAYRAQVDSHFQKILHQDGTVLERAADKINQWTDTAVNAVADGVGDVWDRLSGQDEEREHKLLEEDSAAAVQEQTAERFEQLAARLGALEAAIRAGRSAQVEQLRTELFGGQDAQGKLQPGLVAQTVTAVDSQVGQFEQGFQAGGEMLKTGLVAAAALGVTVATAGAGAGVAATMLSATAAGAGTSVALGAGDAAVSGDGYTLAEAGEDVLSGATTGALSAVPIPGAAAVGGITRGAITGAVGRIAGQQAAESAMVQAAARLVGEKLASETVHNAGASMLSTGAQVAFDEQLSLQQKYEQVLASGLQQLSPAQMAMNATMAFGFEKATQGVIGAAQRVAPELPRRTGQEDGLALGTAERGDNDDWGVPEDLDAWLLPHPDTLAPPPALANPESILPAATARPQAPPPPAAPIPEAPPPVAPVAPLWQSPLAVHPDVQVQRRYQQLLAERGSAELQLPGKPSSSWNGPKEAYFRGLEKPRDAHDRIQEEGYRWVLEESGRLRLDRNPEFAGEPENLPRYTVAGDKLVPRSEQIDFAASYKGAEEPFTLEQTAQYEHLLSERDAWRERRDRAIAEHRQAALVGDESLAERKLEEAAKAGYQMNERSRRMAEKAAEDYMHKTYGERATLAYPERVDGSHMSKSQSGDFDQVWKVKGEDGNETFVVIEAKGGSSRLGTRKTPSGIAQQGSPRYFKAIAENMRKKGATIGSELIDKKDLGQVQYLKIQLPIKEQGGASQINSAKIREFDLS